MATLLVWADTYICIRIGTTYATLLRDQLGKFTGDIEQAACREKDAHVRSGRRACHGWLQAVDAGCALHRAEIASKNAGR